MEMNVFLDNIILFYKLDLRKIINMDRIREY